MTPKAKAKPRRKPQQNKQAQPAPREKLYDRVKRGVLTFLNSVIEAFAGLVMASAEWLGARWNNLRPRGQKAILAGLWVAGVAFGVYSAWFARVYSMPAPVIRWGILRVEARWGVLLLLILLFIPFTVVLEWASQWRSKQTLPRLTTPALVYRWRDRIIPPLAQARWLYVRRHNTRALERTQTLLAHQPDNVAARELLALIETGIARQTEARQENARPEDAPEMPRVSVSQRLLDSNMPSIMARVVATAMFSLCLYGLVYYARVGMAQGWQVTVWTGHDKSGNPTQASALATMLECCLGAVISLLYLVFEERVLANTAVWKKFVNRKATASRPVEKQT